MIDDKQLDLWGRRLRLRLNRGNEEMKLMLEFDLGLKRRVDDNKDAVVAWCGDRGMGKSTGGIVNGLVLRDLEMTFDMSNVFYGAENLDIAVKKVTSTRGNVFVFDEMIDFAYSREAMTSANRAIVKIITKARKLNHIIFLCIPKFKTLDSGIRNDCVNFWIEVLWKSENKNRDKRFALAALFRKDLNPMVSDPWGLDDTKAMKRRLFNPLAQLRFMERMRSYLGTMAFPPIPKVIEEVYEEHSRNAIMHTGDKFLEGRVKKAETKERKETPAI